MEMNRIGIGNDCVEYKCLLHMPLAAGLVERPTASLSVRFLFVVWTYQKGFHNVSLD